MNLHRWQRVTEVFEAALDHPADQRASFLKQECAGDYEIQERVEAMLIADDDADLLMDRPAYEALDSFLPAILALDESDDLSGNIVGDYRLLRELGRGGMGSVYLAYDTRLERQAALKLLPSRFNSPDRVGRLQREARAASAL